MKKKLTDFAKWLGRVALRAAKETLIRILREEIGPAVLGEVEKRLAKTDKDRAAAGKMVAMVVNGITAEIEARL